MMNEFDQKDVFEGKSYEEIVEYVRMEMLDQMKKLQLSKMDFVKLETEGKNTLDKLDQIYMEAYKFVSAENYSEFMELVDSMTKLRNKTKKGIELCQYMEENIDMNMKSFQKVEEFINDVA